MSEAILERKAPVSARLRLWVPTVALLALAFPASAAFEDSNYSPRAISMGGAFTAVADAPSSVFFNPAAIGPQRFAGFDLNYARLFDVPAGKVDEDQFGAAAVLPLPNGRAQGAIGISGVENRQLNFARERSTNLTYATRGFWDNDGDTLDLGVTAKVLNKTFDEGAKGQTRGDADLGALYRFADRYAVGFSLLNAPRPMIRQPDGFVDRAPLTARLGFSETVRQFLLSADVSKRERSGGYRGAGAIAAGMERWWATPRAGSFAARTGLSMGDVEKTWSWGLGWRMLGGQIDYAMTVPIDGTTNIGHAVALVFRFGVSDPEAEYEKVLAGEVGYRKDLTKALEAGEVKQWKLSEELARMREEMDLLRKQLLDKTTSEAEARRKLKEIEDRHREAVARFEKMQAESKRLSERTQETLFNEDWSAYLKLKAGGAPDSVLIEQVRRVLRQYKDKGVDLSEPNQELLRLLRSQ